MNINRPLSVGIYTPTESFKSATSHVAVMFDDDSTLVAVTGYSDEEHAIVQESVHYACLFAAAPELLKALEHVAGFLNSPDDLTQAQRIHEIKLIRDAVSRVYTLHPAPAAVAEVNEEEK